MKYRPCVHCGYCCLKAQCVLSVMKYGLQERCPALYKQGEDYLCALADKHADPLAIGKGCCSPLNSKRRSKIVDFISDTIKSLFVNEALDPPMVGDGVIDYILSYVDDVHAGELNRDTVLKGFRAWFEDLQEVL